MWKMERKNILAYLLKRKKECKTPPVFLLKKKNIALKKKDDKKFVEEWKQFIKEIKMIQIEGQLINKAKSELNIAKLLLF